MHFGSLKQLVITTKLYITKLYISFKLKFLNLFALTAENKTVIKYN